MWKHFACGIAAFIAADSLAMTPSQQKAEERILALRQTAETLYPALTSAKTLPDDLLIGLVVNPQGGVIAHSVAFKTPGGAPALEEMSRMFPGKRFANPGSGAVCVGNARKGEALWCFTWAMEEK